MAIKFLDNNGMLYFWTLIKNKLASKVDKVDGKGLSDTNYTTIEKNKLNAIDEKAQVNVIEAIQKNGVTVNPTNKTVNISVPTKTSEISNDSNYAVDPVYVHTDSNFTAPEKTKLSTISQGAQANIIESIKLNGVVSTPDGKCVTLSVITSAEVDGKITSAISGLTSFSFVIVVADANGKPSVATPDTNKIYLIPKTGSPNDVHDEWAWISNKWEHIGQTDIDLSGYIKLTDLVPITNAEIDTIVAS